MNVRPIAVCAALASMLAIIPASTPSALAHGDDDPRIGEVEVEATACTSVTPRTVDAYAAAIGRALRSATADARANGESGSYAVAARNSRDLLDRARKRVEEASTKLKNSDPRITTSAEGGMVKEHIRGSLDLMTQAGHWALISAAYHKSTDARDAFEGTVTALAEGHRLFAESGRCFLTYYL